MQFILNPNINLPSALLVGVEVAPGTFLRSMRRSNKNTTN